MGVKAILRIAYSNKKLLKLGHKWTEVTSNYEGWEGTKHLFAKIVTFAPPSGWLGFKKYYNLSDVTP